MLNEVFKLFGTIGMDTSEVQEQLNEVQNKFQKVGQTLSSAGQTLTQSLTLPIVGVGAAAIKMGTDFNAAMANVQSLGVEGDRIRELATNVQNTAIAIGSNTGNLAKGLYDVVSAFGDSADTARMLEINAKAAAAGLAETSDVIALTSAITKSYNTISAEGVQHATDLALTVVKLGQTTMPELANAMQEVIPLSESLGVTQEEVAGTFATFTGVAGSAAIVSTKFKGVLEALSNPTKDMRGLMEELGVANGRAMIETYGLQGAIEIIAQRAEETGQPLQKFISSSEGVQIAIAATQGQAETYTEKLEAMQDVTGATDAAFEAQTQGINANGFAMQQLASKMQVAAQKIGDGIAPALSNVLDVLEPVIDGVVNLAKSFANAPPAVQRTIVVISGIVAAIGPLLMLIGSISTGIGAITGLFGMLAPAMAGAGGAAAAAAGALAFLTSPITLIIAGIAALVTAFATDFLGIRTHTMELVEWAKPYIAQFWSWMQGVFSTGLAMFNDIFNAIGALFRGDLSSFLEHGKAAFNSFIEHIAYIFGALPDRMIEMGRNVVEGFINGIQNKLASARETVQNFAGNIAGWFANTLGIRSPSKVMEALAEWIPVGAAQGILNKASEAEKAATELAQRIARAFGAWMQNIQAQFNNGIDPNMLLGKLQEAQAKIKEEIANLGEEGRDSALYTQLVGNLTEVESSIANINKAMQEAIADTIKEQFGLTDATKAWLDTLVSTTKLGFAPLSEAYSELSQRQAELMDSMRALGSDGISSDEQARYDAMLEHYEAVTAALDEVKGQIASVQKLEQDALDKQLARNQISLNDYIANLEAKLEGVQDFTDFELQLKQKLYDARQELVKREQELAQEQEKIAQEMYEYRREIGEVSTQEHLANLQLQLAASAENSHERIKLLSEIFNTEKEINDASLALAQAQHDAALHYGEIGKQEHIDYLQSRLNNEQLTATEIIGIQRQIYDTREAIASESRALAQNDYEFRRSLGQISLSEHLSMLEQRLNSEELNAQERQDIEHDVIETQRSIREQSIETERLMFQRRVALGEASAEDEIAFMYRILEISEMTANERIAFMTQIFQKEQELIENSVELNEARFQQMRLMGLASLEDEINRRKLELSNAELGEMERIELQNEVFKLEQQLNDQRMAIDEALFRRRLILEQASTEDAIARMRERHATLEAGTLEEINLKNAILQEERKLSGQRKALELEEYRLSVELGEIGRREHLRNLYAELNEEATTAQRKIAIRREIAQLEERLQAESQKLQAQTYDFQREQGNISLEQHLANLIEKRNSSQLEADEYLALQREIYNVETQINDNAAREQSERDKQRLAEEKAANDARIAHAQAYYDFQRHTGEVSLREHLMYLQMDLANAEDGTAEKIALEREIYDVKAILQSQDNKRERDLANKRAEIAKRSKATEQRIYEHRRALGQVSYEEHKARLEAELNDKRTTSQRKREIELELHNAEMKLAENKYEYERKLGIISDEQHLENLRQKLAAETQYTDEWIRLQQEILALETKMNNARATGWMQTAKTIIDGIKEIGAAIGGEFGKAVDTVTDLANDGLKVVRAWQKGLLDGIVSSVATAVKWIAKLFRGVETEAQKTMKRVKKEITSLQGSLDFLNAERMFAQMQKIREQYGEIGKYFWLGFNQPMYIEQAVKLMGRVAQTLEGGIASALKNGIKQFMDGELDATGFMAHIHKNMKETVTNAVIDGLVQAVIIRASLKQSLEKLAAAIAGQGNIEEAMSAVGQAVSSISESLMGVLPKIKEMITGSFQMDIGAVLNTWSKEKLGMGYNPEMLKNLDGVYYDTIQKKYIPIELVDKLLSMGFKLSYKKPEAETEDKPKPSTSEGSQPTQPNAPTSRPTGGFNDSFSRSKAGYVGGVYDKYLNSSELLQMGYAAFRDSIGEVESEPIKPEIVVDKPEPIKIQPEFIITPPNPIAVDSTILQRPTSTRGDKSVTVDILREGQLVVREEADIDRIASELARRVELSQRGLSG